MLRILALCTDSLGTVWDCQGRPVGVAVYATVGETTSEPPAVTPVGQLVSRGQTWLCW